MQRYTAILLFGPPGSGKGTQGKALGSLPGFFHCSCGDVFRAMDVRTELGRAFLEYSGKGQLVPDEITIKLWLARIKSCVTTRAIKPDMDRLVLDGIPRNPHQAELMDAMVDVEHVFHLSGVPRDEIALRLKKRALKDNRLDDASDAVVKRRLEVYEAESIELLNHYPPERITHVNATQPPHVVLNDIFKTVIEAEKQFA
ncbi:nucleoside monophosphate kinase [Prosthecobacter sp.]|uniref:adenylate kinase family protein n=1 Tax=Prosthecobacter sp. TaxID=1965333 RepID=UPI002AB89245|nr:nucleoside monophosphate kinase [Prosthecobacter sp.]MDZ4403267.1 nucleoside monophosphate kinase [Prosthecobacter sp.]